ncbi:MAG: PAS domain-containing sensor histidine kinase [Promethearchaeota archaeon]
MIDQPKRNKTLERSTLSNQDFIEKIPLACFIVGYDGLIKNSNFAASSLTGYPKESMKEMQIIDLFADNPQGFQSYKKVNNLLALKSLKGVPIQSEELLIRCQNGLFKWVEFYVNPILNKVGEVLELLIILIDIDEKKKSYAKLQESIRNSKLNSELMDLILDNIPALIFTKDKNNSLLYVNKYFADAHDLKKSELKGKNLFDIYPKDQAEAYWKDDLEVIKSKKPKAFIIEPWKTKEGNKWVSTSKIPLRDSKGEIFGVLGVSLDITEQKLVEDELKESEERYRTLFEDSPLSIVILDMKGRFIDCNPAQEQMYGRKKEELLGKHFNDFKFYSEASKNTALNVFKTLLSGKNPPPLELKAYTKDMDEIWVEVQPSLIKLGGSPAIQVISKEITKTKKAELALSESEEKFRVISKFAKDGIIQINDEGKIIFWNKAAEKIFLYKEKEVLGKDVHKLLAPKRFHEAFSDSFPEFRKNGKGLAVNKTIELAAIRKDGLEIPIELSLSTVLLNKKWNAIGIIRDITERKISQAKRLESEEKYRLITENANDLIAMLNESYEFDYVNEKILKEKLGYTKEEFCGKTPIDFIHPDDYEKAFLTMKKCIEKGMCTERIRWLRKDGTEIWLDNRGKRFHDKEGNNRILLISRDYTTQKKAEIELIKSEEKYRSVLENIEEGYFEVDLKGTFIFLNQSFAKLYDLEFDDILNKNYKEIFDEYTSEELFASFNALYQEKGGSKIIEFSYRKKDGDEIYIESSVYLKHGENSRIIGFRGFCRDITEKKTIELLRKEFNETLEQEVVKRTLELKEALAQQKLYLDEIIKSSQFKTEFLATMSHELRTPLNAIIGFTDLLLEGVYGELNDDQLEFLEDIKAAAEHQFEMIAHILDITKIESGQLELNKSLFNLNTMLEQIKSSLKPLYKKKEQKIKLKGLEPLIEIFADPIRFKEIILNLLTNAIKFTPNGGTITVKVKQNYKEWIISVSDTGIGIPTSDFDNIFKEFKRGTSTYVQSTQGTGLGLSLTKRLVNLHGGQISFTSIEGSGSTFRCTIPKVE